MPPDLHRPLADLGLAFAAGYFDAPHTPGGRQTFLISTHLKTAAVATRRRFIILCVLEKEPAAFDKARSMLRKSWFYYSLI